MAYTALYRRFRPKNFSQMVGQEHIGRTLANAVDRINFVHAYLLCGPRGTGKTSTAKVLAKAVNCLNPQKGEPCGICLACHRIADGESLDILEIDAASNRGIDEIRDLRERVKYAPAQEKFKVYIIDEVHMLTGEAFNALLKTLEEPPPHVIFILATTEPHKIPLTVLSRCQRFDFRRIGENQIAAHLAYIAREEGLKASPEALEIIAKKAEGGMRDAVNLLDQCVGYGEGIINADTVAAVLGCVDSAFIENTAQNLLAGELSRVLEAVGELSVSGKDFRQFLYDLLDYLRGLLLSSLNTKGAKLPPWAEGVSPKRILDALKALGEADSRLRYSLQPRITLELALIQACGIDLPEQPSNVAPAPSKENFIKEGVPSYSKGENKAAAANTGKDTGEQIKEPIRKEKTREEQIREEEIRKEEVLKDPKRDNKESAAIIDESGPFQGIAPERAPVSPRPQKPGEEALSLERIINGWPQLLNAVSRGDKNTTFAFLQWGKPVALEGDKLFLGFASDFEVHMKTLCNKAVHKKWVEEKLLQVFGSPIQIFGRIVEDNPLPSGETEQVSLF